MDPTKPVFLPVRAGTEGRCVARTKNVLIEALGALLPGGYRHWIGAAPKNKKIVMHQRSKLYLPKRCYAEGRYHENPQSSPEDQYKLDVHVYQACW